MIFAPSACGVATSADFSRFVSHLAIIEPEGLAIVEESSVDGMLAGCCCSSCFRMHLRFIGATVVQYKFDELPVFSPVGTASTVI